jgi:hypothetical protein
MRRIWFKKEMKTAILEGRKTATTRDHPIPLTQVLAVSGSRFKAQPFAILQIEDRLPIVKDAVFRLFYREEGFNSTEEMQNFAKKEGLLKTDGQLFYHTFSVVMRLLEES